MSTPILGVHYCPYCDKVTKVAWKGMLPVLKSEVICVHFGEGTTEEQKRAYYEKHGIEYPPKFEKKYGHICAECGRSYCPKEEKEPKVPPIPEAVRVQLENDLRLYGEAFAHLVSGGWGRIDPKRVSIEIKEDS